MLVILPEPHIELDNAVSCGKQGLFWQDALLQSYCYCCYLSPYQHDKEAYKSCRWCWKVFRSDEKYGRVLNITNLSNKIELYQFSAS